MKDVINKRCEVKDCDVQPAYNYVGLKAKFCAIHKKEQMVYVKMRLCKENGCFKIATFTEKGNFPEY